MSNFWNTSDNKAVESTGTFNSNTAMEPIPNGSKLRACIEEAKWDDYEGESFIKLTWTVLDGEYKNRKVFHKVKVKDMDSGRKDKAIRMLAAIDANAGGNLMRLGKEPNDMELMANLTNKPMAIKVGVWEINDKKGNWVQAVSSIGAAAQQPVAAPQSDAADLDIPF